MTPLKDFTAYKNSADDSSRHVKFCCKDLDNKIKTTDRYIDQFLPFRMIKEVSSFMEYILPEEQALKIKVLKDTKMKELYNRMFMLEECIEFKEAMKKLET